MFSFIKSVNFKRIYNLLTYLLNEALQVSVLEHILDLLIFTGSVPKCVCGGVGGLNGHSVMCGLMPTQVTNYFFQFFGRRDVATIDAACD